jgi:hypothetical protein
MFCGIERKSLYFDFRKFSLLENLFLANYSLISKINRMFNNREKTFKSSKYLTEYCAKMQMFSKLILHSIEKHMRYKTREK